MRSRTRFPALVLSVAALSLLPAAERPSRPAGSPPRLVPVAETRLLMQGINMPNFRGLEAMLRKEPADSDAWIFVRGQALLIAENGNLLLLRPPRRDGRSVWMDRAVELRDAATRLARDAAGRDFAASRKDLTAVASVCNRCHQTFRVSVQVAAFGEATPVPPPPPERRKPIP